MMELAQTGRAAGPGSRAAGPGSQDGADPAGGRVWRLLDSGYLPAARNMAIDEAVLESHRDGLVPPTLRFYGWQPAAVSIGYFQRLEAEVDLAACRRLGVDVVRRATGGRAVLHEAELTYSVVIRQEFLPGDVISTYRVLCEGLVDGLRRLDVPAEMALPGDVDLRQQFASSSACFNTPSWYEVVVGGKKVVGSAQMRRDGVILQHGSILLRLDSDRLFAALRLEPSQRETARLAFLKKATSLHAAAGREITWQEARDAVTQGFASALGLSLSPGVLTAAEEARAQELEREKYGSDTWNAKK